MTVEEANEYRNNVREEYNRLVQEAPPGRDSNRIVQEALPRGDSALEEVIELCSPVSHNMKSWNKSGNLCPLK